MTIDVCNYGGTQLFSLQSDIGAYIKYYTMQPRASPIIICFYD